MLEEFDFEMDRINTIIGIMGEIPIFKPDDLDQAAVIAIRDAALAVRNTKYIPAEQTRNLTAAQATGAVKTLHEACVSVYSTMKLRYRDTTSLEAIERLPVGDNSSPTTDKRARAIVNLWKQLPLPPNAPVQPGPLPHFYIPYDGMSVAVFEALITAKDTAEETSDAAVTAWELAEGELHEQSAKLRDFTVAAGAYGRAQFPNPASWERDLIDTIPTDPPVAAPGTCTITQASSDNAGEARIKATCERAVKYDVEKSTEPDVWEPLVTDAPLSLVVVTGLAPGNTKFRMRGKNSVGTSEWSEPAEITVA
jgi:hypothetical protein